MNESVFELHEVCFSYLGKFPALKDVTVCIRAGEKIAIMGANGSGKSTFLHLLDGLIFPDKGSLRFSGRDVSQVYFDDEQQSLNFRKKVGLVFQNPDVQLFCPTVREDIVFGPLQLGLPKSEVEKKLQEVVDFFKIGHLLNRAPYQLSIGEKKKVSIASVLAMAPDVLLLDEPTAGLDPRTTRDIVDILIRENVLGKTVITATHDLHLIEEIGDMAYVFSEDKHIIRSGRAEDILSDIHFLEEHNLVHAHKHCHKGAFHTHPHLHRHAHQDDTHHL